MPENYIKIGNLLDILKEDKIYSNSSIVDEMILKHSLQNKVVLFYNGKKHINFELQSEFDSLEIDSSRDKLCAIKEEYEKRISSRADIETERFADEDAFSAIGSLHISLPPKKQKQLLYMMIFSSLGVFAKKHNTNQFYKISPVVDDGKRHRIYLDSRIHYIEIGELKSYLRAAKYPLPASIYEKEPDNTASLHEKISVNHSEVSYSLDEISDIVCDFIANVAPNKKDTSRKHSIRLVGGKVSINFENECLEPQSDLGFRYIYHIIHKYPDSISCSDLIQIESAKMKELNFEKQSGISSEDNFGDLDGSNQEVIDEKTKKALKDELEKLESECESVMETNTEAAAAIQEEIQTIKKCLRTGIFKNKLITFSGGNEKNRKSVSASIKRAIRKLDPVKHKKMKSYFSKHIETGNFCRLSQSEPQIPWAFE